MLRAAIEWLPFCFNSIKMQQLVLLGAEAIAQGALDSGISGVYAYPGTPSTEITEYIQRNRFATENGIHSQWSANEKTAMESALGMSYAGKRSIVCMKHVGLNVAADGFINAAITGSKVSWYCRCRNVRYQNTRIRDHRRVCICRIKIKNICR